MKAVLVGADLMYRQDGKLVPIEINTNTGWDVENRLEPTFDDIFDFDAFKAFLDEHEIEEIWVDGLMSTFLTQYFGVEKGLDIKAKTTQEFVEAEDRDDLLLLRTSYSDEALVDAFCRDKGLFLRAIESFDFGCNYILKTAEGLKGEIVEFVDNGDLPNFIVKYRYPYYDRGVYPKLVKLANAEELQAFLESEEMEEDYLIMPFYFNEDQLWEEGNEKRMKLFRHFSMFSIVDDTLEAVPVATYTKLCGNLEGIQCQYSELGVLDSNSRKALLNYWTDYSVKGDVLAEQGDLVLMADNTWKPVEELAVGDEVKSLDIPTKDGANIKNRVEDYNISFEELQESSSYSINRITQIGRTQGIITKVGTKFVDGTDWWDTARSSYPTLDPEDGTIWFRTIDMLRPGDKIVLLDTSDLDRPIYLEKEIREIARERKPVDGYQLTLDGSHLFLTKEAGVSGAYASIEHNANSYNCVPWTESGVQVCLCGSNTNVPAPGDACACIATGSQYTSKDFTIPCKFYNINLDSNNSLKTSYGLAANCGQYSNVNQVCPIYFSTTGSWSGPSGTWSATITFQDHWNTTWKWSYTNMSAGTRTLHANYNYIFKCQNQPLTLYINASQWIGITTLVRVYYTGVSAAGTVCVPQYSYQEFSGSNYLMGTAMTLVNGCLPSYIQIYSSGISY